MYLKMFLKIFPYFLILIQFEFITIGAIDIKCDQKTLQEMDRSITKLIVIGQKGIKFPTNSRQLRPYCNLALKTFEMISGYIEKCLPKFGRDSAKLFMHSIGVELKGICKTGRMSKRARELLGAAPCANAGLKNWQKCNLQLIDKFTGIINAPIKQRLPMGCCNFHQMIRCLTEEAEELKECTPKTIDYVIKYIHKLIDPLVLILCNEYSEPSDRCDAMVRITPNRTSTQPVYKSFLIPIIDISISLGDEVPED